MTDHDGRLSRLGNWAEARALTALAVLTSAALVVAFYYPTATVLIEAVVVDGAVTLGAFAEVLTDPFYFGELARLLSGESPVAVARALLSPDRRLGIVGFTAYQAVLSTVASVALGLPAAYLLARFEFPGRRTLRSLTIVPFVLPSIMVAVGFVATFGENGTLNAALTTLGLPRVELMFTLEAVVIAHAFYNAPLVARVTTAAWESVDASAVETARSLGAGPVRAFVDVVAPQVYPAVLTGAALTFVFTFGTFPIVLALGGFELVTVEVLVYRLVRDLSYAEAAVLAIIELAVSLGVLLAYLRYEARQSTGARGARPLPRRPLSPPAATLRELLPRAGLAAYGVVAGVVFLAPIASMVLASVTGGDGALTLDHYRFLVERQQTGAAFQVRPWPAIRNSLAFATGATLLALPMGVVVAVLTTRRYRGRTLVDAAAMAPLAVSGIIVGLGLLRGLVFGVEIGGWRIAASGAAAIVVAHAVSGYPFVVRTVSPGLAGLDRSLVESARALGASRARVIRDVEIPLVWPAVVAGAAFAFAVSIGEFTSTVVLATGADAYTMPVAIERFIGRRLGPATAMGVVLLVVTGVSFVVIERLGGDHRGL
ncbi:thiamine transport system permease protein [Halorubrum ezzemoulense]|uniref:Thiamine transport system permease protein n=1 Tax=Halorubrum ezzemoulense TaxID=337243 RepID=A0A238X320_HALEZ|nr:MULTISPECIES: iron ABC transporter permease [Halorubrum]MDB2238669.1 iron ABC transporter permease [Halorubrum ezzemoulense]MDB2247977.1 iron ABC transporter permease [Halorubrum ezzemoulense]MDB2264879.1 iron ABC transporter permease [Halorubrum ezzemoulense]MDB2274255.1 iron ABC transporter permease [Halorubrum ezzemoulense]MDB9301843.1 iron ABC transporter permease [Halorubrum ezzemoulense]